MSQKLLKEALEHLERIDQSNFRSDPDRDEAIRRQYEYIIHVLAEEVLSLGKVVKSICDDRP